MIQAIVIGVIVVAILGAFTLIMRWGMKAKDDATNAADRMHSEGDLSREAIAALVVDRDHWKQKHDVAASQLAAAKVRLATAETQRNNSAQAATTALVEKVKASGAQVAADVLNSIVGMSLLPDVPKDDPAGPRDSDRGAARLHIAGTPPADK